MFPIRIIFWLLLTAVVYYFSVNTAFATLRTLIPTEPEDRKLSKIETLRLACSYIAHLAALTSYGE